MSKKGNKIYWVFRKKKVGVLQAEQWKSGRLFG